MTDTLAAGWVERLRLVNNKQCNDRMIFTHYGWWVRQRKLALQHYRGHLQWSSVRGLLTYLFDYVHTFYTTTTLDLSLKFTPRHAASHDGKKYKSWGSTGNVRKIWHAFFDDRVNPSTSKKCARVTYWTVDCWLVIRTINNELCSNHSTVIRLVTAHVTRLWFT